MNTDTKLQQVVSAPTITLDADNDQFPDALEAANGLTVGSRDNNVFLSDKLFVMQLYRDILYREGDSGGVQFYQNQIDSGLMTRSQLVLNLLASPESQTGVGALARLYIGGLHRLPDPAGMEFWITKMNDGTSLDHIAASFAASNEFNAKYGSLTNKAFVDQLYIDLQGRVADTGGETRWVDALNHGTSRGEVLLGFTDSTEYKAASDANLNIAVAYLGLLGRSAKQSGYDFWTDQQNSGVPDITIIGEFIASHEYHDRFMP